MLFADITPFIAAMTLLAVSPATGAFLKFWADRASEGRAVMNEGSRCDSCGKPLRFWEAIPILSWVAFRGRTRCCGQEISPGLLTAEIAAVTLAIWGLTATPEALWVPTLIVAWMVQAIALLSAPDRFVTTAFTIILTTLGLYWAFIGTIGSYDDHLLGALIGASLAGFGILDKLRGGPMIALMPAGALLGATGLGTALFIGLLLTLLHYRWTSISGRAGTPYATSVAMGLAGGIWLVWLYGPSLGF